MTRLVLIALLAAMTSACGGALVILTPSPALTAVALPGQPHVYMDDGDLGLSLETTAFRTRERELLAAAGATVVDEHDAGGATLGSRDLVVRVSRTIEEADSSSVAAMDVRIFAASGATLRRDAPDRPPERHGEERMVRIDTSDRSPLVHAVYSIVIHTAGEGFASAPQSFEYERELGRRRAELCVAQLMGDLERAERLVAPTTP